MSNSYNPFKHNRLTRKQEMEKKQKQKEEESLKIEYFPELVAPKTTSLPSMHQNYIETLTKPVETTEDITPAYILPFGWTMLKATNKTNNKTYNTHIDPHMQSEHIVRRLNALHQDRTNAYIELNGYDTWERVFKFPNWIEWETKYEDDSDDNSEQETSDEEYNSEYEELV